MVAAVILASLLASSGQEGRFVQERTARNLPLLVAGHHFAVVAHRGNHVDAPENTIDAYKEAIRVGADYGETDLRPSKDGVIVLMHDGKVDRTTDGHGDVRSLSFAEIRALHLKGARHEDEKVPTFEELLTLAKGKLKIYMDIKDVTPEQVVPLLQKHHMEKDVIAYVYSGEQADDWMSKAPGIPVISDFEFRSSSEIEGLWKPHPFAIFDGGATHLTAKSITELHRLNLVVWPDIQNPGESPKQWQPFIDMGVDGFQTDHPEMLVNFLKEKGIR